MNAIVKGIAQARHDGEAVTLGMIVVLIAAASVGVIGVFGFWAIAPYAVGLVAGVLGEAVIVHMQRYVGGFSASERMFLEGKQQERDFLS